MTGGRERLSARLDEVTAAMESLTAMLDQHELDLGQMLQAVCEHVVRVVAGADMASITLVRDGAAETVASTDQRAVNFDREQYRLGDGPCLQAARTGTPVRVGVGAVADQWPQFASSARDLGVSSFLAAPLTVDEDMSGSVNLFGFGEHGFGELEVKVLELYTAAVVFGLRSARRYFDAKELVAQLNRALETRAVIDQAKGILMAAHRIDAEEAFRRLVKRSQDGNQKLYDVAAEFVAAVSQFT
ncbi:GAF and ANTAR domain-containing protein [Amycolatopsis sp. PS_44_ISF1]|uniref:GAF and ANTAR domain-containing protein n=1 Tax=Amycolatopsis sp. PS_44_ISF1 TaxID=2974917 RepID=UPI0028DD44A3|nr:GAF and ANTAR domain-containing protein [Amycolatopsis sp. PS_44_ISF1]MDT8912505.1 GAF and ANTAR domain-containing protein [Amycolatopsis sp. PS_44_ISF1]